jgi:hypothetical protein
MTASTTRETSDPADNDLTVLDWLLAQWTLLRATTAVADGLKDDERWFGFIKQATQTKFETVQTELAFLVPPTLKSKARYMNLQCMFGWAQRVLTVLDDPTLITSSFSSDERLQAKFAWLTEYLGDVQFWCSWLAITDASLDLFVVAVIVRQPAQRSDHS